MKDLSMEIWKYLDELKAKKLLQGPWRKRAKECVLTRFPVSADIARKEIELWWAGRRKVRS